MFRRNMCLFPGDDAFTYDMNTCAPNVCTRARGLGYSRMYLYDYHVHMWILFATGSRHVRTCSYAHVTNEYEIMSENND